MIEEKKWKSTCHCNSVELEIFLPNGLDKLIRCNCSICSRKGAIIACTEIENLKIIRGENKLTKYSFHTHKAQHYFCSVCGIYTHHRRRSNPNQYGFNVGCLEGIKVEELKDISYVDGRSFD